MKIMAFHADGSAISIDQKYDVEKALKRRLHWQEVPNTRETSGNFFQAYFESEDLSDDDSKIAKLAIVESRDRHNDSR